MKATKKVMEYGISRGSNGDANIKLILEERLYSGSTTDKHYAVYLEYAVSNMGVENVSKIQLTSLQRNYLIEALSRLNIELDNIEDYYENHGLDDIKIFKMNGNNYNKPYSEKVTSNPLYLEKLKNMIDAQNEFQMAVKLLNK